MGSNFSSVKEIKHSQGEMASVEISPDSQVLFSIIFSDLTIWDVPYKTQNEAGNSSKIITRLIQKFE